VRHALEWGRTYASATSPPDLPAEDRERARTAYTTARQLAQEAGLDGLAVDAVHMMAFVDTAAADQIRWAREALAIVEASEQPEAKGWEASLRNNLGYALHQSGEYEAALAEFTKALVLRETAGDEEAVRVARWMVAWTLRALGRADEALEIQLRLEKDCEAAGRPDPYVFEELETLYRERGDASRAAKYADLRKTASP
jgi:tetratricopeptide (TPR) repeat protein